SWHAVPILILDTGTIVIPTNVPGISLQPFANRLAPSHTIEQLEASLTRFGTGHLRLTALGVLEIRRTYANPYEGLISMRDCSGDGEDRRGSGTLPLPELINQCISGRCEW
ncbi:MAG: DUF1561 family protein, partial [Helicobacter sp.]|nr:DUF1561 family protein [Helicobacter sp.]MDY5741219.1 DUF1561 family protein [Helicobacter sp.]